MRSYKKLLKIYIPFFMILSVIFAILYFAICFFLLITKENFNAHEIIKYQYKNNALYSTIADSPEISYYLVRYLKPDIITLGSSRVMQFRKEMFNKSFVTTGGSMNSVDDGVYFLEQLLPYYKPKKIIIGLDIWWFNPAAIAGNYKHREITDKKPDLNHNISVIFKQILDKKITIKEILAPALFKNDVVSFDTIGYGAYKNGKGHLIDGSYFYGEFLYKKTAKYEDYKFSRTLGLIDKHIGRFAGGDKLDEHALKQLNKIIEICNKNNIELVMFLPPFAPDVHDKFQTEADSYKYISNLKKYLKDNNIAYFDFSNPYELNSSNCEFIDGFHGGNVTYARIVQKMLPKDSADDIDYWISKYKNNAVIKYDEKFYNYKEIDFIGIGCQK